MLKWSRAALPLPLFYKVIWTRGSYRYACNMLQLVELNLEDNFFLLLSFYIWCTWYYIFQPVSLKNKHHSSKWRSIWKSDVLLISLIDLWEMVLWRLLTPKCKTICRCFLAKLIISSVHSWLMFRNLILF